MRRNYHKKLSASIYHHTKNVVIIGILEYPKKCTNIAFLRVRIFRKGKSLNPWKDKLFSFLKKNCA